MTESPSIPLIGAVDAAAGDHLIAGLLRKHACIFLPLALLRHDHHEYIIANMRPRGIRKPPKPRRL